MILPKAKSFAGMTKGGRHPPLQPFFLGVSASLRELLFFPSFPKPLHRLPHLKQRDFDFLEAARDPGGRVAQDVVQVFEVFLTLIEFHETSQGQGGRKARPYIHTFTLLNVRTILAFARA